MFRHRLRKLLALAVLTFFALLVARFVAGYFHDFDRTAISRQDSSYSPLRFESIAYDKALSNTKLPVAGVPLAQVDVFAKEARLMATTRQFERDEAAARAAIDGHEALVRIERKEGLKPRRSLQLVIRVPVERFDSLVEALRRIGEVDSFSVTKEDQSAEARQLLVERKSLENYRDALIDLRQAEGEVADLLALEERIQQLQAQVEQLNAELGRMIGEKSYHNVSYDLAEAIPFYVDEQAYPLAARIADTLVWTVQWYIIGLIVFWGGAVLLWAAWVVLFERKSPPS